MLRAVTERNKKLEKEVLELRKIRDAMKKIEEIMSKISVEDLKSVKSLLDKKHLEIQSSRDIAETGQNLTTEEKWSQQEEQEINSEINDYKDNIQKTEVCISSVEEVQKELDLLFKQIEQDPNLLFKQIE